MIVIPGYKILKELHRGAKRIVYRGEREQDNTAVIIKTPKTEYPSPAELADLKYEYELIKDLDVEGIVKPYALEESQTGLALILEDMGGESLKNLINTTDVDLPAFLKIAVRPAETLEELHKNNIIHKDVNPKNIIVNIDTKQVKLIDFGLASVLPRENPKISSPNVMEGTLAYMSPEQTGRMNRGLDYRTDFYSLGITFYELLCGHLPFETIDAMEVVHSHIAKTFPPPRQVKAEIPPIVSEIVMKLLAKNAEDRYQSAYGLKTDLEKCYTQLQETGEIEPFTIGADDVLDKFQIPEKLYGREQEIDRLMTVFDRVALGSKEIAFCTGGAGIGKSSLINEIHKPIVKQNAAPFDQ